MKGRGLPQGQVVRGSQALIMLYFLYDLGALYFLSDLGEYVLFDLGEYFFVIWGYIFFLIWGKSSGGRARSLHAVEHRAAGHRDPLYSGVRLI
jgi:hypothetical protein